MHFPTEPDARLFLETQRWPHGAECPRCHLADRITTRARTGFYRCNRCLLDFTVRTGTVFERSKVPLHQWLTAIQILLTADTYLTDAQLGTRLGVNTRTAWAMRGKLRAAAIVASSLTFAAAIARALTASHLPPTRLHG